MASLQQAVIIRQADMTVSQWAGGSTKQLAIYPAHSSVAAQDFLWRFSSATVEQDGDFTLFPGHQRLLGLRQGAGFSLKVDQHQAVVSSPYQTLRFAGSSQSSAKLTAGAITDINLMLAAGYQGNLQALSLSASWQTLKIARPEHSTLLFWCEQSDLEIRSAGQSWQLSAGDLLQLNNWPLSQQPQFCAPQAITAHSLVLGWFKADNPES